MVFRNFRLNIVLRVLILNLTILCICWLALEKNYYITTMSLILTVVLQIVFLIQLAERTNTMFIRFLNAIHYDDFSQTYTLKGLGKSFDTLNQEFNKVVLKFQEIRAEKEAQYHYLKSIVQHIGIGLIVFDEKGQIELINNAAKKLLSVHHIQHLCQFREEHQDLVHYLEQSRETDRELIKLKTIDKILHLAVRKTSVKVMQNSFTIVSIQDIQSELEDKEMEAWQNLIRVLTHEIINSVTPISSLAGTINEELEYHLEKVQENETQVNGERHLLIPAMLFHESVEDVHYAVKTIQKRSEGLIRFVKDFRSLTKIPMPNLESIKLQELLHSIVFLQKEEFRRYQIDFTLSIEPNDLKIIADPHLLEQVFINLLKNSMQALDGCAIKKIHVRAYQDIAGKVMIEIEDTGIGISEEAMKNIFIPFFTTKKSGSGIGLSLSRQVMRLHGGSIQVRSKLGEGTVFILRFA